MEDDWKFFDKRNYISECLQVLNTDVKIGQCLINKNYAETPDNFDTKGGFFNVTRTGLRYYIHEFCSNDEDIKKFISKYGNVKNCSYWPHFSFRPSLIKTSVLREIGEYNEKTSHFEMEYSHRYTNNGFISAFLESIYCIHTGRLTSERDDPTKMNAYILNNENQFTERITNDISPVSVVVPEITEIPKNQEIQSNFFDQLNIKTFVINLDTRQDRWNKFTQQFEPTFLNYQRYSAVNGYQLSPNSSRLQKIFEKNDFNMRKGMVGCALSHIKLWIELLNDDKNDIYFILEDDVTFVQDFEQKMKHAINDLVKNEWDIFYLGHHVWENQRNENLYNKTLYPTIQKMNRMESLLKSMGGTFAYMITKKGAEKLLEFINSNGMTNGIDTVQQKSGDHLNLYYSYPHLVYSDVFNISRENIDTDIQKNFESLSMNFKDKLIMEINEYTNIKEVYMLDEIPNKIFMYIYYFNEDEQKIRHMSKTCKHLNYTIDDRVIFLCPNDNGKHFHMFKKYGRWNIDDAILFE